MEVLEAKGLKKYDVLGKSDPFVELSTMPQSKEKTSVRKKTLTPTWNETKHVLVQVIGAAIIAAVSFRGNVLTSFRFFAMQEPRTQFLRVEMFDHDTFQPKVTGHHCPSSVEECDWESASPLCCEDPAAHHAHMDLVRCRSC